MAESVEKKRGRPRVTKKVTQAGSPPETVSSTASVPVQLTIASYGRKPRTAEAAAAPKIRATKKPNAAAKSSSNAKRESTPIVVSLPVTNEMEENFQTQHTLDDELTTYRPDVFDVPVPKSIISSGVGNAAVFAANPEAPALSIARCSECTALAFPCQKCIEAFNTANKRSFNDYQAARDKDDMQYLPGQKDEKAFQNFNEQVTDKPLPKSFHPPEYVSNLIDTRSAAPAPFVGGYEPTAVGDSETKSEPAQASSAADNEDTIERLQAKIAFLEAQLRNRSNSVGGAAARTGTHECMWHLEKFSTQPIGLPTHYDDHSGTYETLGCFCSFPCAYAYRLEHRSAESAPLWLLFKAYNDMHKEQFPAIAPPKLVPAPPRQALKRFGGPMELEEFLKNNTVWHVLSRNPLMPNSEYVEASDMGKSAMATEQTTISSAEEATDSLLRKREKPHPNAANQWNNAVRRTKIRK